MSVKFEIGDKVSVLNTCIGGHNVEAEATIEICNRAQDLFLIVIPCFEGYYSSRIWIEGKNLEKKSEEKIEEGDIVCLNETFNVTLPLTKKNSFKVINDLSRVSAAYRVLVECVDEHEGVRFWVDKEKIKLFKK